jgi:hypothetical protein
MGKKGRKKSGHHYKEKSYNELQEERIDELGIQKR